MSLDEEAQQAAENVEPSEVRNEEVVVTETKSGGVSAQISKIIEKFKLLAQNPRQFFEMVSTETGIRDAAMYFMLFFGIGLIVSTITAFIFGGDQGISVGGDSQNILSLICLPITAIIGVGLSMLVVCILALLTQIGISLFKGQKKFEDTFRLFLYCYGTMGLLLMFANVPILGMITSAATFGLPLIGISYGIHIMHKLSIGKSIVAALTPNILIFGCLAIVVVSILGTSFV